MKENGKIDDLSSRLQWHGVLSKKSNSQQSNKWTKRFVYVETNSYTVTVGLDWRQCGNSLALCYFAVVMELPDFLLINCKPEFGVIFLRCSPT